MDIFKTFIYSFVPPRAFVAAPKMGFAKAFAYFAFVSIVSAFGITYQFRNLCEKVYDDAIGQNIDIVKDAKIREGKVVCPSPVEFKIPETDITICAVSADYLDAAKSENVICAFEKDMFSAHAGDFGETRQPLSEIFGNGEISMKDAIETMKNGVVAMSPVGALLASGAMLFFYAAMLTPLSYIVMRPHSENLGFGGAFKIATVSATPPIAIQTVSIAFWNAPLPGFLFAVISGVLLFWAASEIRRGK